MIEEVRLEKDDVDEKTLKDVLAGLDTGQHGNCSCYTNCGSTVGNDAEHSDNNPL